MNVACLEKMLNCGNLQKKPKPIFFMGKYLMKKLYIGGIPQAALHFLLCCGEFAGLQFVIK